MENKYFKELARRLNGSNIEVGMAGDHALPILLHGQTAITVRQSSDVFLAPESSGDQEAGELYHRVSGLAREVKEYTAAMERAPVLKASGLDEDFRVLADFNGVVLAGHEMEHSRGYQFVTWKWDYNRTGVMFGDYYINDYEAAKKSFATRSGLVAKERLFTDEQLTELYRGTEHLLEEGPEPTPRQSEVLSSARKQIEQAVPDLLERLEQGQGQDQELKMRL